MYRRRCLRVRLQLGSAISTASTARSASFFKSLLAIPMVAVVVASLGAAVK